MSESDSILLYRKAFVKSQPTSFCDSIVCDLSVDIVILLLQYFFFFRSFVHGVNPLKISLNCTALFGCFVFI